MGNVIYSPDSLILKAEGITNIRLSEVLGNTNTKDNWPANKPDGWVVKKDSPYYDPLDDYGGQDELSKDAQIGAVKKYPGYIDGTWMGRTWDSLPSYTKMEQHMEKPLPSGLIGFAIHIECEVQTTNQEFQDWLKSINSAGYDDSTAVDFDGDDVIINTKYSLGLVETAAGFLFRASGSEGPGIIINLYIPLNMASVKDKFLADLETWRNTPKLKKISGAGNIIQFLK